MNDVSLSRIPELTEHREVILCLFGENRFCLAPYVSTLVTAEKAQQVETMDSRVKDDSATTFGFAVKPD